MRPSAASWHALAERQMPWFEKGAYGGLLAAASAHGDTKVPTALITLTAFTALTALTIFPMRGAKQALNRR